MLAGLRKMKAKPTEHRLGSSSVTIDTVRKIVVYDMAELSLGYWTGDELAWVEDAAFTDSIISGGNNWCIFNGKDKKEYAVHYAGADTYKARPK